MEAVLLVKDTLNVNVSCDSLLNGKLFYLSDSTSTGKNCVDCAICCHSEILITFMICITILLIAWVIYLLYNKKLENTKPDHSVEMAEEEVKYKQKMKDTLYQELKLYRTQLANFKEKQAIIKEIRYKDGEEQESIIRIFDSDKSDKYIAQLEKNITELSSNYETIDCSFPKNQDKK